ncbi:MAG TPA: LysM peptidoglycan-binding domain-containing protein [Victivallales bacterium]|nr:LysM peptidoglycan-binding domain-containing protein [Victivallales bacterium]
MKSLTESVFSRATAIVGTGAIALLIGSGCSSDKVLTDRPFIPAASDQIPSELAALPPLDSNVAPAPDVPAFPEYKAEPLTYTVKKGDSLWKIARMYGVSMQELAAFNDMDLKKVLKVGSALKIPPGGALIPEDKLPPLPKKSSSAKATAASSAEPVPADGTYSVKSGDSLWKIARKFNTSIDKLAAANAMDSKTPLQVGQKIKIPGASGDYSVASEGVSSQSPAGETSNEFSAPTEAAPVSSTGAEDIGEVFTEGDVTSVNAPNAPEKTVSPEPSAEISGTSGLPATSTPPFDEMKGFQHDVEAGETWASIAAFYGYKPEEIKKANPAASAAGEPKPGTKVVIPSEF